MGMGAVAHAADKVVFQLGWLPTGDIAAAYVGVAKGYFAAEGLDVSIRTGRGSLDVVSKIETGVSDIGATSLDSVLQYSAEAAAPVQLKVVMSQYTKMPDALLTVKGGSIHSIKDVVGHTVATATFSGSTALWPVFLRDQGIDPASVNTVKADVNALPGLLASGKADATINWVTAAPGMARAVSEAGKSLVVMPWSNFGHYEGYGYVIVASGKMIKERPDVLRRFLRAYRRTLQAAIADPALVGAAVKAQVPEADPATVSTEFAASIPLIQNDIEKRDGLGSLNPAIVKATWTTLARSQGYPVGKIDPETVVDREFLGARP